MKCLEWVGAMDGFGNILGSHYSCPIRSIVAVPAIDLDCLGRNLGTHIIFGGWLKSSQGFASIVSSDSFGFPLSGYHKGVLLCLDSHGLKFTEIGRASCRERVSPRV